MRVEVTQQVSDLEIVLVSPRGTFWRDDDGGVGLNPLVKANTPVRGWYTLPISSFNAAGSTGNFTAKYGRYNSGNPNCNAPAIEHGPTERSRPGRPRAGVRRATTNHRPARPGRPRPSCETVSGVP